MRFIAGKTICKWGISGMSVFFESSGLLYPGLMMLWSADQVMNPIG